MRHCQESMDSMKHYWISLLSIQLSSRNHSTQLKRHSRMKRSCAALIQIEILQKIQFAIPTMQMKNLKNLLMGSQAIKKILVIEIQIHLFLNIINKNITSLLQIHLFLNIINKNITSLLQIHLFLNIINKNITSLLQIHLFLNIINKNIISLLQIHLFLNIINKNITSLCNLLFSQIFNCWASSWSPRHQLHGLLESSRVLCWRTLFRHRVWISLLDHGYLRHPLLCGLVPQWSWHLGQFKAI